MPNSHFCCCWRVLYYLSLLLISNIQHFPKDSKSHHVQLSSFSLKSIMCTRSTVSKISLMAMLTTISPYFKTYYSKLKYSPKWDPTALCLFYSISFVAAITRSDTYCTLLFGKNSRIRNLKLNTYFITYIHYNTNTILI